MSEVLLLNYSYVFLRRPLRFAMPSILRMLYYIKRPRHRVGLTKKNVLLRDHHVCQYCGFRGRSLMTVDHVEPKSRGGRSTWESRVAACSR